MLSKKIVGVAIGAVMVGTQIGRQLLGAVVGQVKQRMGAGGSDPFAVAPSDGDIAASSGSSAAELSPEERQALAEELPPTPGTLAVVVGAPNAPDLDVITGDHDGAHRSES